MSGKQKPLSMMRRRGNGLRGVPSHCPEWRERSLESLAPMSSRPILKFSKGRAQILAVSARQSSRSL